MRLSTTIILGLPMLIGGFVQFVISQFYQKFATDSLLLDSALIGGIFFVSRVTDAVLDPICGYLSDKWRRRRAFIGAGVLALAGGTVIAFVPGIAPAASASQGVAAYVMPALGIFVIYLGVTLTYIPHYAWLGALQSANPTAPLFASRAVIETIGTIFGALALKLLVPYQKTGGFTLVMIVAAMVGILALLAALPLAKYRDPENDTAPLPLSFLQALSVLARNRAFALIAAMSFFNQFAATTLLAVSLYFTDYVLGQSGLGESLAVAFLLSATAMVPVWSTLSRRFNRHRLWAIALICIIAAFPTLFLTTHGFSAWLIVFAVIAGGFAGAVILYVPQEISFATEATKADEGLYFAAFTFVNKSAMACAPLIIGLALSFAHYQPQIRVPAVANTISALFIGLPAIAFTISLLLLRVYTRHLQRIKPS